ncbi:response regulator [Clostridium sp. SHJSY1]|uniref:response regulator n=1 Tax=Clostridium sp. SHJSY1 TaxID=2942483 RepID=UPI002875294F|nr:response regulator [Clostridium sp. SHJSY1]MDS0526739.1 response regulator [Clostridium sp. SHJSY1]
MRKVLIVDNSSYMRLFIKKIIEKIESSSIFEASGKDEAIESFNKEQPDIVFLDLNMSEARMDGITVLSEIMKINPETVVIITSAVGHEHVKDECLQLGAKEYIRKPFDTKELIAILDKYE